MPTIPRPNQGLIIIVCIVRQIDSAVKYCYNPTAQDDPNNNRNRNAIGGVTIGSRHRENSSKDLYDGRVLRPAVDDKYERLHCKSTE
jgi:hypothetical protein